MANPATLLDDVGRLAAALTDIGLEPILVGGMALVTLGSRRVTRDFDFVIARPGDRLDSLVDVLYDCELELAARVNDEGDVTATIDNRRVAAIRLRIDAPSSASFYCHETGLRVDLLFDFPFPRPLWRRLRLAPRSSRGRFGSPPRPISSASSASPERGAACRPMPRT